LEAFGSLQENQPLPQKLQHFSEKYIIDSFYVYVYSLLTYMYLDTWRRFVN